MFFLSSNTYAQTSPPPCNPNCGIWTIENKSSCDLEFLWETPNPCRLQQGLDPFFAGSLQRSECAPQLGGGDCPVQCAWALRLVDPNGPGILFYAGGPSVYYNVADCAACNTISNKIMATYVFANGSHKLVFDCQP